MSDEGEGVALRNHNNSDATTSTQPPSSTNEHTIKSEDGDDNVATASTNGHVGENGDKKRGAREKDGAVGSGKRRKVEGTPRSGLSSRAVSPPWQFGTVQQASIVVGGRRMSSRFGPSSPALPPAPEEHRPRRESASKPRGDYARINNGKVEGTKPKVEKRSHKKKVLTVDKDAPAPTFKKPARPAKRVEPPSSLKTPRHGRSSSTVGASSEQVTASSPNKGNGRRTSRRSEAMKEEADIEVLDAPPSSDPSPGRFQRLRLRVREPTLGRSHPLHWPLLRKYTSFQEWLDKDDPLEGETGVPITNEATEREATARLRIAQAVKPGGVLTEGRSERLTDLTEPRIPPVYDNWSHLCTHLEEFKELMRKERKRHKLLALQTATACQIALASDDRWVNVRERKSSAELLKQEQSYRNIRMKQVIKDLDGAWALARLEVNKIRFEQWEKEQDAIGKKALDDMLDQSTQLLYQNRMRDSSEFPSEGRSSVGPTGSETGTGADDSDQEGSKTSKGDSENMSESSEDDEDVVGGPDEDANLSPDALKRKYAAALEQDVNSDASESGGDEVERHGDENDSGTESEDTAESDDEDDAQAGSLAHLLLPKTRESAESPGQAAEVDSKMADADTLSVSNTEKPLPELEEVDEALLDHSSDESIDMDDEDESDVDGSDEASEEDEESEDDDGLMGFFAKPKEKPDAESSVTPVDTGQEVAMDDAEAMDVNDAESVEEMVIDTQASQQITRRDKSQPSTPHTPVERVKTEVPSLLLRGSLRAYQHDGLDWLAGLYQGNRNGILADEMGLGKTIQTISLLAHLAVNHKIWGPHLVVVPTSVMLNWEMEFKKWLPGFKILTYYGDIEERKKKRQGWLNDDKWNVCIASYQLILKDAQAFKKRSWHYLILDEAHYIKNFQSQKWQTLLTFKTHSRLLLTGTPLQNDLQELWSLLYFLMPAGLDGSGGFADLEKFLNSMKRPADQILNQGQQKLDAEAQERVSKLHEVLRPFLLRRLKSEVEKQMPGKYEHVVYCRLSKRQRQLYDEFMSRGDTKSTLASGNYMSIMNCLMSLRKVCNHPDLFETRQIVTSYAMSRSAVADFEIKELFVRRRLLQPKESVDLEYFGLLPTAFEKHSRLHQFRRYYMRAIEPLQNLVERQSRRLQPKSEPGYSTVKQTLGHIAEEAHLSVLDKLKSSVEHAKRTTEQWPIYGTDFVRLMSMPNRFRPPPPTKKQMEAGRDMGHWVTEDNCRLIQDLMPSLDTVASRCETQVRLFSCITPKVVAEDVKDHALNPTGMELVRQAQQLTPFNDPYHEARMRASIAFPDKRLLQYDCGKLQALDKLLRELQAGGHRCLIFTQMTKVLDILEQFLNIHGHRYSRLDGSTKIEQRQILTDRFNNDTSILAFILSSRSGGLGINLTGADTVIFYDLDWNPAMDAQCQDRCHRIGQTRDVHIYRFVSEYTIEANILRKSNQKRLLDDVIIQKGEFTTEGFNNRVTYKDAFAELKGGDEEAGLAMDRVLGVGAGLGKVMESVEDVEDVVAGKEAQKEAIFNDDANDFVEDIGEGAAVEAGAGEMVVDEVKGAVDEWMVRYLNEYEMWGLPVVLPRAVLNAKKNARKKRTDYQRIR